MIRTRRIGGGCLDVEEQFGRDLGLDGWALVGVMRFGDAKGAGYVMTFYGLVVGMMRFVCMLCDSNTVPRFADSFFFDENIILAYFPSMRLYEYPVRLYHITFPP